MSREELVGAYVNGRVSRRVFIRGLVGLGVTAAAAVTYADSLSATTPTAASPAADIYPDDSSTTTTTVDPAATSTVDPGAVAGAGLGAGQGDADAEAAGVTRPRFTG
jgi:hypothetical protein